MKIVKIGRGLGGRPVLAGAVYEVPEFTPLVKCPACASSWGVEATIDRTFALRCQACKVMVVVGDWAFPANIADRGETW